MSSLLVALAILIAGIAYNVGYYRGFTIGEHLPRPRRCDRCLQDIDQ